MRSEARVRRLEADSDTGITGDGIMAALRQYDDLLKHGSVEALVAELRRQERSNADGCELLTKPCPTDRNGAILYQLAKLRSERDERDEYVTVTAAIGRRRGIAGDNPKAWAKAVVARASGPDGPTADAIVAAMEG